jgi:tetratricopeptide (TPR) repeat protein
MKFNFTPKVTYRNGFILVAVLICFTMNFLSFDYGITEDTRIHNDHGKRILNYFKGLDNSAALSPIDDQGKYMHISDSEMHLIRGMNGFGGFFDLVSNFLYQFFSFFGVYEFNNMINSIFGFLLFLFCGLLGKELGGWKVGLLTLVFVTLTPVLFGHSMNNPKDIPAAAFYMFSLFHTVKLLKELPVITLKRSFFLILNISLLINIRVAGLMFIGYVLLIVFVWWFIENYESKFKKIKIKDSLLLAGKTIVICMLSYLAASIFWPYGQTNPLLVPLEVLFKVKEFDEFVSTQLFEGEWRGSFEMPWYYAFKSLLIIQTPLHIIIGMILIPLLYFKQVKGEKLQYSIILFTTFFPLLLIIIGDVNSYSNSRQFLFVVPPMIVLSVLAYFKLFKLITQTKIRWAVFIMLGMLLLQPLRFMIVNHPLQSTYYSPVIGGVKGAYGNYEIDYWGFGIKPAITWLKNNVAPEFDSNSPARIRMYYGEQSKLAYYLDKTPNLEHVLERRDSPNWDYSIIMLTEARYKKNIDVNWSPESTVHKIKVDGIPVCYIVKNTYQVDKHLLKVETEVIKSPSVQGYIELSLLYYKKKDFFKSIEASKKVLSLDPNNSIAYNNLCSAYNNLLMYDEAKIACERSLLIKPKTTLTINNLGISNAGIDRRKNRKLTPKEYLSLSYNYYKLMEYDKCIKVSAELLELEPNNVVAYNNICSSYNAIGNHDEAIKACEKALEINPDFQLAKNNLNWAKKQSTQD